MEFNMPKVNDIWSEAIEIWQAGGWGMIAIGVVALVMFSLGCSIGLRLLSKRLTTVSERRWRQWLEDPSLRRGRFGKMLTHICTSSTLRERSSRFKEIQMEELYPIERDLRVMKICVGAAPLFGLLGTVVGMLETFSALATGSGGDQTMKLIAGGISEALITTETGLVVSLPGLIFWYFLSRQCERYKAFLLHVETASMQRLYGQLKEQRRRTETACQA